MEFLNFSKEELKEKIARACAVAEECQKEYGGSKMPFLVGAYEGIFMDLLGISEFNKFREKVGQNEK